MNYVWSCIIKKSDVYGVETFGLNLNVNAGFTGLTSLLQGKVVYTCKMNTVPAKHDHV